MLKYIFLGLISTFSSASAAEVPEIICSIEHSVLRADGAYYETHFSDTFKLKFGEQVSMEYYGFQFKGRYLEGCNKPAVNEDGIQLDDGNKLCERGFTIYTELERNLVVASTEQVSTSDSKALINTSVTLQLGNEMATARCAERLGPPYDLPRVTP